MNASTISTMADLQTKADFAATISALQTEGRSAAENSFNKNCDLCNLRNGATEHTKGECCIACRNYELIDFLARKYALQSIKKQKLAKADGSLSESTVGELLEQTNNLGELTKSLAPHIENAKKEVDEVRDKR